MYKPQAVTFRTRSKFLFLKKHLIILLTLLLWLKMVKNSKLTNMFFRRQVFFKFFEKLLNSDMKESSEGVVRFKMLTELDMRDILEFIYTDNVQTSTEDNAKDVIMMADYLVVPRLKTFAEKYLFQEMNASNSISTYLFAEKYLFEELLSDRDHKLHPCKFHHRSRNGRFLESVERGS